MSIQSYMLLNLVQYLQDIVDTASYSNPTTFICMQKNKIIPAKITMLDDTEGNCARDLPVLDLM